MDRDADHARIEIAALAQEFAKAEALAHVKGRQDGRVSMAIYISDPNRASPVRPEFNVSTDDASEIEGLAAELHRVVKRSELRRDVALAAIAELSAILAEAEAEPNLPLQIPVERSPARRRRGSVQ